MPLQEVLVLHELILVRRVGKQIRRVEEQVVIPDIKRDVGNGHFVANEIFLLGEDAIKDGDDADDLLLVSVDCAGELLGMPELEPKSLSEVWSLAGYLEGHPLIDEVRLLATLREGELVLLIIASDEVSDDRRGFPKGKVVVVVINNCRDTSVRVVFEVLGALNARFIGSEFEEFCLVLEAEFLEDDGDFPAVGSLLVRVECDHVGWFG